MIGSAPLLGVESVKLHYADSTYAEVEFTNNERVFMTMYGPNISLISPCCKERLGKPRQIGERLVCSNCYEETAVTYDPTAPSLTVFRDDLQPIFEQWFANGLLDPLERVIVAGALSDFLVAYSNASHELDLQSIGFPSDEKDYEAEQLSLRDEYQAAIDDWLRESHEN